MVSVVMLNNHIALHKQGVMLMLVPKAATTAIKNAVSLTGGLSKSMQQPQAKAGYYKIGIVRNTWDRLVSCWHQKTNADWPDKVDQLRDPRFTTGMNLTAFLEVVAENPRANHHFYPQDQIIGDCDEIWHTEQLIAKWAERLPKLRGLCHDNVNVHRKRDFRPYYTDGAALLVAELYQREIDLYGFRFQ